MEQYIVRKITKTIQNKYYHKFYDKRDKEIKDTKYIENKVISNILKYIFISLILFHFPLL